MKKLIISILTVAVAFGFTACDKSARSSADAPKAPASGNSALDSYMKEFEAFVTEYVDAAKAAKAGDAAKLQALASKVQEFAAKSQDLAGKITAEEAQKLQEFAVKQAERMQKAME